MERKTPIMEQIARLEAKYITSFNEVWEVNNKLRLSIAVLKNRVMELENAHSKRGNLL